jgi:putative colanic acid biosynthesis acetyltransferase WcaF
MTDPYLAPAFPLSDRFWRLCWIIVAALLFTPSPRPLFAWRAFLLRCFGARLGNNCKVYPRARIWAPWNLRCGDVAAIADEAVIYNPAPVALGTHAIVSQQAYLCGATHDYTRADFPLLAMPITIGDYAWICARATVQPGIRVGDGAVLGLGSVATKELAPWTVYAGVPARPIKKRPGPGHSA